MVAKDGLIVWVAGYSTGVNNKPCPLLLLVIAHSLRESRLGGIARDRAVRGCVGVAGRGSLGPEALCFHASDYP